MTDPLSATPLQRGADPPPSDLDLRRLALEETRVRQDHEIALRKLAREELPAKGFSAGSVTLIGAVIALVSAATTAAVTGSFNIAVKSREVEGNLAVKRTEVEGQLAAKAAEAEAQRIRLETEQRFGIIVQATKDQPIETAVENLKFFVEAGILADPEGRILTLAEQGKAPTLATPGRTVNMLEETVLNDMGGASTGTGDAAAMNVRDGVLYGSATRTVSYREAPALGPSNDPAYAVIHGTGATGMATVAFLQQAQANASAHLVIGRDGSITQMVPFGNAAFHAANGRWGSLAGFNRRSIGIELENAGLLTGRPGAWTSLLRQPVPDAEVANAQDGTAWHSYPEPQVAALAEVLRALRAAYPEMVDILAHGDIDPRRKTDPGPLFPMAQVRQAVFGRAEALPPP